MSTQRLADRDISLDGDGDHLEETDTQFLVSALEELLGRLAGRTPGSAGGSSEDVETWESEEFLYVETALACSAGAEIDVSIQGGRAFIRMAR
jgi:hypothetical protein